LVNFNKSSCDIIRNAAASPGTTLDDLKVKDFIGQSLTKRGSPRPLVQQNGLLRNKPVSISPVIPKSLVGAKLRKISLRKKTKAIDPFQLAVDPLDEIIVRNAIKGLTQEDTTRLLTGVEDTKQLYERLQSLVQDSSNPDKAKFWKVADQIVDSSDWRDSYSWFIKNNKLGPQETEIVYRFAKLSPPPTLGVLELVHRIPK
jgi:hypothetical protein